MGKFGGFGGEPTQFDIGRVAVVDSRKICNIALEIVARFFALSAHESYYSDFLRAESGRG